MGIRQRGDGWLVDVTVKGERRTVTCATRDEAKQAEVTLRADIVRGVDSRSGPRASASQKTLQDAYNAAARVWKGTRGEKVALINAESALKHFGRKYLLTDLTTELVTKYVEFLEDSGKASATVNRKIAALSKMMTIAEENGWIERRPQFTRKREGQGRVRWLSPQEEATALDLLTQWGRVDHRDALIVLVDTGLRLGELWRVAARDIDTNQGLLAVWQNKSDLPRSVPMTTRVREIIVTRMGIHPSGPLFPFHNGWFRGTWDRLRTTMKLDDDEQFVPHVLRHTCASRLVQRGVGIPLVQQWLGHRTIQITMRYSHLAPVHLLEAAKVLEAA
jgi:integrase